MKRRNFITRLAAVAGAITTLPLMGGIFKSKPQKQEIRFVGGGEPFTVKFDSSYYNRSDVVRLDNNMCFIVSGPEPVIPGDEYCKYTAVLVTNDSNLKVPLEDKVYDVTNSMHIGNSYPEGGYPELVLRDRRIKNKSN